MARTVNVALIGYGFMGRAHANAWKRVGNFFDLRIAPRLTLICGRSRREVDSFARRWEIDEIETDWHNAVEREDVDISVPTHLHAEIAIAAAQNGKHVFCEKPLALSTGEGERMLRAAMDNHVCHYLNHNYRRCPAVALARRLVDEGMIGRPYHWKSSYLQSWIADPRAPLTWHLRKELAGAGPHFDLHSHSVDLARLLLGEVQSVMAMTGGFIDTRPVPGTDPVQTGPVTVEDYASMLVEFESGALGVFETSRLALGRKSYNQFEIYGSAGSIASIMSG